MNSTPTTTLDELASEYTWLVNAAIEEDRTDLAMRLSSEFEDASLRLITAAGRAEHRAG